MTNKLCPVRILSVARVRLNSRYEMFFLLRQALKALANISWQLFIAVATVITRNKKVNLVSFKKLIRLESSLDIWWKGQRGAHMPPWAFSPWLRRLTRNRENKALFRVLEDKVELGRRAERDVELGLRRNPGGRCPFRKWGSSEMFKWKTSEF